MLIVWDGMRPDFVNERYAPTLNAMAYDGVRFQNHHSVYVTATDVNGAALATGLYPNRNGIFANVEYGSAIDPRRPVDTAEETTIRRGDEASGGKYLNAPTIAELLHAAGRSVAIAGSKSVVLLHDRHSEWTRAESPATKLTVFAAAPMPTALRDELLHLVGPFPIEPNVTGAERARYATRALTDVLWRERVPDFSLLWSGEPDLAQHNHAPGSPEALAAIKANDDDLAQVLHVLDAKHARDNTNVLVVSDHGFSTIRRSIDVVALLNRSGLHADKQWSDNPNRGDILAAANGGSVLFYVRDHDRETCERLTEWLEESDFAGALFTREKFEGTFPLSAIHIDTSDTADVVMAFRWSSENNQFGVPGVIDADWNRPAGNGTHATLSAFDVHNTLIAAGPDFRRGFEDNVASGNIDIAPTILQLLNVRSAAQFDGRVLREALSASTGEKPTATSETITAKRPGEEAWQQSLKTTRVEQTIYFDAVLGGKSKH